MPMQILSASHNARTPTRRPIYCICVIIMAFSICMCILQYVRFMLAVVSQWLRTMLMCSVRVLCIICSLTAVAAAACTSAIVVNLDHQKVPVPTCDIVMTSNCVIQVMAPMRTSLEVTGGKIAKLIHSSQYTTVSQMFRYPETIPFSHAH